MSNEALLQVRSLAVHYPAPAGQVQALSGVDLEVAAGECLGLVGESGAGKTAILLSILGLLPPNARLQGSIRFSGEELAGMPLERLNEIRGTRIAMVFQDPMSALESLHANHRSAQRSAASAWRPVAPGCRAARARDARRRSHRRARTPRCVNIRTSCPAACASAS